MRQPIEVPDEETAFHYIVQCLRESPDTYARYGFEVYLPGVIARFLETVHGVQNASETSEMQRASPPFFVAAWDLARRGIFRPGISELRGQGTEEGANGAGFAVTPVGRKWIADSGQYDAVPIEPGRFSRQLSTFVATFGESFEERSQEAIRCYGAHAYLACCAMCGAASEAILLALASAKSGDRAEAERQYLSSGGRGRIEKLLVASQPKGLQSEFSGYMTLLKYWRDAAAHGHRTGIGDNEAYTSLMLLLRFGLFATDRWAELVGAGLTASAAPAQVTP